VKETTMANHSRWEDAKNKRRPPTTETRSEVEHDLALGQLIHDLRTGAGLSQRGLAERMGPPSP
jgi:ribosome-binding protein aMBF1 (putative translation factor)